MKSFYKIKRFIAITKVIGKYQITDLLTDFPFFQPLKRLSWWFSFGKKSVKKQPRAVRIRLVLEELGPIFVKFGQILSTRQDLLPPDIAIELAKLQDNVPPFPSEQAVTTIEKAFKKQLNQLFQLFETEPLASASVAQVHAATMHNGDNVVVKIIRPNIEKIIQSDINLLYTLAELAEKYWEHGKRLKPTEVIQEFEKTIFDELDMQREAANCSLLRKHWENSEDLYVPKVYWSHTKENVFVMERINGIAVNDMDTLRKQGIDLKKLAERGVKIFYTQVFQHNFFHADMHPGNIKVAYDRPDDPYYLSLDFGIIGSLSWKDQYYLAQNFDAFFKQDYRRVAELHIESGWVPAHTRIEEFESAIRTVCEPNFAKPLSEISFGEVLLKLFKVARRFDMVIQPQLVLLQKTLLNIEGLGRQTYPELDLWSTAKPILEKILKEKYSIKHLRTTIKNQLPLWLEHGPKIPEMVYNFLKNKNHHIQSINNISKQAKTPYLLKKLNALYFTISSLILIISLLLLVLAKI